MNAFTIYLVMQASTFAIGVIVAGIALSIFVFFRALAIRDNYSNSLRHLKEWGETKQLAGEVERLKALVQKHRPERAAYLFCATIIIGMALPSTKTLCAMVILPKLADSQMVQKDLPEIYDLAVKKLKDNLK